METPVTLALIASFTTLGGLVLQMLLSRRRAVVNEAKLEQIHVLVNSRLTEALAEIRHLKAKLETEQ